MLSALEGWDFLVFTLVCKRAPCDYDGQPASVCACARTARPRSCTAGSRLKASRWPAMSVDKARGAVGAFISRADHKADTIPARIAKRDRRMATRKALACLRSASTSTLRTTHQKAASPSVIAPCARRVLHKLSHVLLGLKPHADNRLARGGFTEPPRPAELLTVTQHHRRRAVRLDPQF